MRITVGIVVLCAAVGLLFGQWQPEQRLTCDSANSYLWCRPSIVANADTLHVIYVDDRTDTFELYYTRSLDAAVTWDSAVRVSVSATGNVWDAALAAASPYVYLVWPTESGLALKYRHSTDAGASWSVEETLAAGSECGQPCLSAEGDNVGLVWTAYSDVIWGGDLYYKQSSDHGATWTPDTLLTPGEDSTLNWESFLGLSGSRRYLAWTRRHWVTNATQTWWMRSTDAGATWEPRLRLATDTTYQDHAMVAADGADVDVVWHDARPDEPGIRHRHSSDCGATWSPEEWLSDGTSDDDYPTLAVSGPSVQVAWSDVRSGQFDIGWRRSTDHGLTWEPDTLLTNDPACDYVPGIAASDERVHLLWCGDSPGNYEVFYKQNPTGSVAAETPNAEARTPTFGPTVVRGTLRLDSTFGICNRNCVGHSAELLDISGRVVLTLKPGANDVSALSPGVYFVREKPQASSPKPQAVRKVVLTR